MSKIYLGNDVIYLSQKELRNITGGVEDLIITIPPYPGGGSGIELPICKHSSCKRHSDCGVNGICVTTTCNNISVYRCL